MVTLPRLIQQVVDSPQGDLAGIAFPHKLVAECSSVLLMFCAGLYGRNDGYWVREHGLLDVTGVDLDSEKLEAMTALYPFQWTFTEADCFEWKPDRLFDVVFVDAPTLLTEQAATYLPRWCSFAERAVVLGLHWESLVKKPLVPPRGFTATQLIKRANHRGGTYWLVVERT